MPRSSMRRPATASRRWASKSASRASISPRCSNTRSGNVESNVKGVDFLFKKNKIEAFHGEARIVAPGKVEVKGDDGKTQTLETKNIVIATGSDVARLNGIDIDEKRIVSSTGALELAKVPQRLLVVGAGIIGMELGSVWRRLGAEVTIVEFLDHILPGIDSEVARQFHRIQQKQGIAFKLSSKVTAVDSSGKVLKVKVEPVAGGAAETDRSRCRPGGDRPDALHRGPRSGSGRRQARQSRPRHRRCAFPHQRRRRLRHRRRDRRPHARRTRPRRKAWRSPKSSPGRPGT